MYGVWGKGICMIHYHGTPISGTKEQAVRFLTTRHALVSFASPGWIDIVAECCSSFVLDNGAFSHWKRGEESDFNRYIGWVADWCSHPGFDWALIPDVIGGSEADNDYWLDAWPLDEIAGVPVWHMHESWDRLENLAHGYSRIAIGSSGMWPTPGTAPWWERISDAMNHCCDAQGKPLCRLHGLRMMDPAIFSRLPFASADSSNASRNAGRVQRFGQYVSPSTSIRAEVIASRIEVFNSSPVWVPGQERLCDMSLFI